ncbi:MAG: DUF484 domain-containing protein [Burkholderiales bacterium]|jgi:uncharacterized protein YigA (DUF484 family)|nr:MAG: DUF484 domain-containing protein [Burkholderiales bacterium]
MTRNSCDADDVAHYLYEHPDFFESHVELLASITVPHPHGGRAISLQERQLEVLREKLRAHEMKLAELVRIGQENDAIAEKLHRWTRQLLLAAEPQRLPEIVVDGLRTIFAVPQVAMRLWGLRDDYVGLEWAQPVAVDAITLANSMKQPFCGPNSDFHAATWLPDGGASTHSIALLPLRKGVDPKAFGLVVLGSSDPERFRSGMGTAFLERIAGTAGAALSRLAE